MKNRLILAVLAAFFIANTASALTFSDVGSHEWFYSHVEDLVAKGIVDGSMGQYRPGDMVNRAEMSKLIVEAFEITLETPQYQTFTDVPKGEWFFSYVETVAVNGIAIGYLDENGDLNNKFGPNDPVTREQAAKMIVLGGEFAIDTECTDSFPDVAPEKWSYEYVSTLSANSIIDGYTDKTFRPENNINRAEIAKIVSSALNPVQKCGSSFSLSEATSWSETGVEVCFSEEYDEETGLKKANYSIKDESNNDLAVKSAAETSDPLCVQLSTEEQEPGEKYEMTVQGVTSKEGGSLEVNSVQFEGIYIAIEPYLDCSVDEQTENSSVAQGATNVPFLHFTCTSAEDGLVLMDVQFHYVGTGNASDIDDLFLYEDDVRLTESQSVDTESLLVRFEDLDLTFEASSPRSFTLTGNIAADADVLIEHAFEIEDSEAFATNTLAMPDEGFPFEGATITIVGE